MATSHTIGNVKLREKSEPGAGNGSRSSKVNSMIELFSNSDQNRRYIAHSGLNPAQSVRRIATILESKQDQEDITNRSHVGRLPRQWPSNSIAVRVPKPYSRQSIETEEPSTKSLEQEKPSKSSVEETIKSADSIKSLSLLSSKSKTLKERIKLLQNGENSDFQSRSNQQDSGQSHTGSLKSQSSSKMGSNFHNGDVFGQNSYISSNGGLKTSESDSKLSKSDERRISNARNYFEHKIERKNEPKSPNVTPFRQDEASLQRSEHNVSPNVRVNTKGNFFPSSANLGQNPAQNISVPPTERLKQSPTRSPGNNVGLTRDNSGSVVASRLKRFGAGQENNPSISPDGLTFSSPTLRPKSAVLHGNDKSNVTERPERPAVPARPRVLTSRPKPYVPEQNTAISLSSDKNTASPLAKTPPLSPRANKTAENAPSRPAKLPLKRSEGHCNTIVNPVPKPERTFTFSGADIQQGVKQKSRHYNVVRVSSDLSTITGPGIDKNLSHGFGGSTPDISTRAPKEGYEEVTFFGHGSQTMEQPRKKWDRQHNYEEVEETLQFNGATTANYDHINLDLPSPRPLSLDDLSDSYSHLKFKQDLHTTQSVKPASAISSPRLHHMKLKKQNSDMSDAVSRPSAESTQKNESGLLQITDKIRDAFTQISRKYRHHRQTASGDPIDDPNGDPNLLSSSGDEDSDTETDFNKHRQTLDRVRSYQKTYRKTLKYKSLERELSKCEESTIFEQVLICKIVKDPDTGKLLSKVSYRFPAPPPGKTVGDEKTLAQFCFPDIDVIEPCQSMQSHSYSFMLTRENGTRKFGYCRRILPPGSEPRYPLVYCLISPLGSFGMYELILDELEMRHRVALKKVSAFLDALFVEQFPAPGRSVAVQFDKQDGDPLFILRRPFDTRLEHVHLQCLLSELGVENTIKVFASLLLERRVILCGKSLSILTACIHALRALLYPFVWQHVFIPVLPLPMIDLCCSPTPLLIGIMDTSIEKLRTLPLEEVFIINLTTQEEVSSMGDEMDILPRKLQTPLIDALRTHAGGSSGTSVGPSYDFASDYESAERNTVISEAFMHLFVEMIGHYQHHFYISQSSNNTQQTRFGKVHRNFNRTSFYDDVTSRSLRRFLDLFMGTQMFDGFIHSRELANVDYEGLFERRIAYHLRNADASQLNFKVIKTKVKKIMLGIGRKRI